MSEYRMTAEDFLENRKADGRVVDVEREIWDAHCQILDPFGVDPPPEGSTEPHCFLLDVYPLSGRAMVLGIAEDGGDCDASIHLEDLTERITWAQYHLQYQVQCRSAAAALGGASHQASAHTWLPIGQAKLGR